MSPGRLMKKPISWLVTGLLLAVPVVGVVAAVAYAADLCLTFAGGPSVVSGTTFVVQDAGGGKDGKNMSKDLSQPNKCKSASGFFANGALVGLVAGVNFCTTADSSQVNLSANNVALSFLASFPPAPIPNSSGIAIGFGTATFPSSFSSSVTAAVCVPPSTPVPPQTLP